MIMSRIIAAVLVAAVLILPTLFAGGNLVLLLLPKAEALTIEIDITTDTTWGDKTIFPGTIYNIAAGATLTIKGKVTNNGDINVYGTLDIVYPKGELYVTKQGKEMGTLYVHSGGTVNNHYYLRVNGLLDVNPGGTLYIHSDSPSAALDIYGTLNIDGSLVNDDSLFVQSGAVLRINEPAIFENNDIIYLSGTLNINNGAELDNEGEISSSGTLKVFSGGTLDNSGGTIYKYCGGTITLSPGSSFTGDPIEGDACIAINNVSLNEGNSGTKNFGFKVTRSGITTGTTTLNWITGSRNSNCRY